MADVLIRQIQVFKGLIGVGIAHNQGLRNKGDRVKRIDQFRRRIGTGQDQLFAPLMRRADIIPMVHLELCHPEASGVFFLHIGVHLDNFFMYVRKKIDLTNLSIFRITHQFLPPSIIFL